MAQGLSNARTTSVLWAAVFAGGSRALLVFSVGWRAGLRRRRTRSAAASAPPGTSFGTGPWVFGGGRLLGVRHCCARRLLRCVWEGRAGGCPRDGLLPRDAREPASTPRWRRRGRGRNVRRVRRIRRAREQLHSRGAGLPRDLILAPDAAWHRRVSRAALDGPRLASGRRQPRQLTAAPIAATRLRAMRETKLMIVGGARLLVRDRSTEGLPNRLRRSR
jgi:hypothetical protein